MKLFIKMYRFIGLHLVFGCNEVKSFMWHDIMTSIIALFIVVFLKSNLNNFPEWN